MSILETILSKIFSPNLGLVNPVSNPATTHSPLIDPMPVTNQKLDVTSILTDMASRAPEKLNWQTSIVDLMSLLNMDSSLTARKDLARELGYKGDMSDSSKMNIWLQKQVMDKLEANGGRVPTDLLH